MPLTPPLSTLNSQHWNRNSGRHTRNNMEKFVPPSHPSTLNPRLSNLDRTDKQHGKVCSPPTLNPGPHRPEVIEKSVPLSKPSIPGRIDLKSWESLFIPLTPQLSNLDSQAWTAQTNTMEKSTPPFPTSNRTDLRHGSEIDTLFNLDCKTLISGRHRRNT